MADPGRTNVRTSSTGEHAATRITLLLLVTGLALVAVLYAAGVLSAQTRPGDTTPHPIVWVGLGAILALSLLFVRQQRTEHRLRQQERRLEEAESRRLRLNALGEFAGSIAHDFNNILTVILGNAELLDPGRDPEETKRCVRDIQAAGERAAELVSRLLAFGRPNEGEPRGIDLNEPVRGLHQLLHRLLGEQHELVTLLSDEPVGVKCRPSQVEQLLTNLTLNARDALPDGGTIRVETTVEQRDGTTASILRVTDEGVGMDAATRARVFEPFFTTKPRGAGTGLGLSTVYGIVESTGGEIDIDSQPGRGTIVELRWPRAAVEREPAPRPKPPMRSADIGAAILLVEDDPSVARLASDLLRRAGHHVTQAANGIEGFRSYARSPRAFDLVLSDVVLPQMSGFEMAANLRRLDPSVRVGFVSGYTGHRSVGDEYLPQQDELLRKPFSRAELLDYVARRLGDAPPATSEVPVA